MKKIFFIILILAGKTFAQEINTGMNYKVAFDSLRSHNVQVDTFVTGKLLPRVSIMKVPSLKKFGLDMKATFYIGKSGLITTALYSTSDISYDDYDLICSVLNNVMGKKFEESIGANGWLRYWKIIGKYSIDAYLSASEGKVGITFTDLELQ